MDTSTVFGLAFAIGCIAGLRTFTPLAAAGTAAYLGWINLQGDWLAFLGNPVAAYIFGPLALAELVTDKLPNTPSRKTTGPFVARIVSGGLSGAALGAAGHQSWIAGAVLGGLGAVAGTLGGYEARTRLVKAFKSPDFMVALLEDAVAVGSGLFLVTRL